MSQSSKFILSLDQGTSSSRAILFDESYNIIKTHQVAIKSLFPLAGWVEQDPEEIFASQLDAIKTVIHGSDDDIISVGITNQRETIVIWDKKSGKPVYNAIVWQDTRTSEYCSHLKNSDLGPEITSKTGLIPDSYFSASKIKWILDNVKGCRKKAKKGELLAGTIDTWLLWKLSRGRFHYTDVTNASRTMLFDIHKLKWSMELLDLFDIPKQILPEVKETCDEFGFIDEGYTGKNLKVCAMAGDQQAALFGQLCFSPGSVKNTYGTGCFMLMNTGENAYESKSGLLTTIAWKIKGRTEYAIEGSVFIAGAVVQWLRDNIGLVENSAETEQIALKAGDSNGVYFVPAFSGIGAPFWDMNARGAIIGLSGGTRSEHIIRAALESMAYQTKDVLNAMMNDTGIVIDELKVDGGAANNNFLMQFQSDILNAKIIRPEMTEITALGAALLAGSFCGVINKQMYSEIHRSVVEFQPSMPLKQRSDLYKGWKDAVRRLLT